MNGWLKLHRRMKDHPVWQLSDGQFKVWITCMILANTKERSWDNKTDVVTIKPGSFVTSLEHLAKDSRTSIKTVRLALKALGRIGSIRAQIRAQRYTLIELVNWPTWNGSELDEGTDEGISGAQLGHSRGTVGALTEEGKKVKKEKKETYTCEFLSFWDSYPRKESKQDAWKAWNQIAPQNGLVEIILASVEQHKPKWTDQQYIPLPASYLRGKRWEDILETNGGIQPPVIRDPKSLWKNQEEYLAQKKRAGIDPRYRVTEWELTA